MTIEAHLGQGAGAVRPDLSPRPLTGIRLLLRTRPELFLAPAFLVAVLLAWQFGVQWMDVPSYILPPPSEVLWALWKGLDTGFTARGGYWLHAGVTLMEVLLGFVIGSAAGLLLGTIVSQVRIVEATFSLYLVAIQSLPKIALAPIIVLWFGFGLTSKVVIICLLTFFPLMVNSMAGFKAVEPERIELMRAIGANPWQLFWKVRLPSAMPYIFAGLNMAAVFAVVGAVVGEFVGAQRGLGVLILSMNASMDTAGTFSVFIILSLIGILLHGLLRLVERRVLFWSGPDRSANAAGS
ncbi:ABC transporter permease [Xanthobacter dioxanivorans]|uniref:ABC transporter permease n=1 Tax=Xanthobacter dioxanivorans TaxID=2528964 RepID=A0A974PML0_9HYPH|nr:ABC transporter permease [Xanthobacter dioxanivorans]QRG06344.1 ABC transporter permease [Xanthobacter dioxanivorans]